MLQRAIALNIPIDVDIIIIFSYNTIFDVYNFAEPHKHTLLLPLLPVSFALVCFLSFAFASSYSFALRTRLFQPAQLLSRLVFDHLYSVRRSLILNSYHSEMLASSLILLRLVALLLL